MAENDDRPPLTLRWTFKEYWWGELATFRGAGFEATAQDCDGDFSIWIVKRHGIVIGEGQCGGDSTYYHLDACLLAAEAAVRETTAKIKMRLFPAPPVEQTDAI